MVFSRIRDDERQIFRSSTEVQTDSKSVNIAQTQIPSNDLTNHPFNFNTDSKLGLERPG